MRKRLKRWAILGLGWLFVVLGIAGLFLPFLQGILFLVVGLVLLSRESRLVKRFLAYIRLRYPKQYARARAAERRLTAWWRRQWRRGPER